MVCVFTGGGRAVPESGAKRRWLIPGMGEATSCASGTQVHKHASVWADGGCDQTPCSSELCLSYRPPNLHSVLLLRDP